MAINNASSNNTMITMNAAELQAEQGLLTAIRATVSTIERLITERDKFRDALSKISLVDLSDAGAVRAVEIARKTLEK